MTDRLSLSHALEATKQDLQSLEQRLNSRIELIGYQLLTRLSGVIVVSGGILFAALKYFK